MQVLLKERENIWFFVGRSIGVTLLGMHALELAKRASLGKHNRYFLVYTHTSNLYTELSSQYPYIELVHLTWKNLPKLFFVVITVLFHRNFFIYPPSFGQAPVLVRIFSSLINIMRMGRGSIAWLAEKGVTQTMWYTHILPLELNESIFTSVSKIFPAPSKNPSLLFSYDASLERKLPLHYIVFHPFATNERRTYPDSLSKILIAYLIESFPNQKLILSAGPAEVGRARAMMADLNVNDDRLLLLSDLSAGDFKKEIQIVSSAQLYIGIDTGITHVAAHLNVPMIVLGNLSNPMWLPTYSNTATVLFSRENCTCTPDKKGDCQIMVDGQYYYRCMVEISWQSLCSAIELRLHG